MQHLDACRMKDFMLAKLVLSEREHEHLSRCSACQAAMAEATLAEFRREAEPGTTREED
jgi:hypothetical protein